MKELGLTGLPVTHIENASATGLVAFREAAWAVSSGRADVAMALCFDKFTDMAGRGGGRGGGRDEIDAPDPARRRTSPCGRSAACTTAAPRPSTSPRSRPRTGTTARLSPMAHRRPDHVVTAEEVLASRMVAEPLTAMMCCPADDGAACVILARDDLVRAPSARSHARAPAGVGAAVGVVRAGPHVRRAGGRAVDDDPRHRASSATRRPASGPTTSSVAYLPRRVRQRGARVLRAARVLRRGRGRQARRRRRDRPGRPHPVQHRRRAASRGATGRPDRARHDPRVRAAAAGRGRRPPGRRRPGRARAPRGRRQRLHGEPARRHRRTRTGSMADRDDELRAPRPARRSRASCGPRPAPRRPAQFPAAELAPGLLRLRAADRVRR